MSKEQWGHGYMKGYEDSEKRTGNVRPKYILSHSEDGELNAIYYIRSNHGYGIYTVELINYFTMLGSLKDIEFDLNDKPFTPNVYEIDTTEPGYTFVRSWQAVCGAFIRWADQIEGKLFDDTLYRH